MESYKLANLVVCQPSAEAQDKKGTDNRHRNNAHRNNAHRPQILCALFYNIPPMERGKNPVTVTARVSAFRTEHRKIYWKKKNVEE